MNALHKLLTDVALWTLALPLAFWLRFDGNIPAATWPLIYELTIIAAGIKLGSLLIFKPYKAIWRRLSFDDLKHLIQAAAFITLCLMAVAFLFSPYLQGMPRSIPFLDGAIGLMLLCTTRFTWRYYHELKARLGGQKGQRSKNTLIVGAGEAGSLLVREMRRHPEIGLAPLAFVDDDTGLTGQRVTNVPVKGTLSALPELIDILEIDQVIIAIAAARGPLVKRVIDLTSDAQRPVKVSIIPGMYELLDGKASISRLRDVSVEDLLGRSPVRLDYDAIGEHLRHKVVLVTGAGGSIGSELVRQIVRFQPEQLILFGRGENSLFQTERELAELWPEVMARVFIGDVRDAQRVACLFKEHRPDAVFHAAAHKHVPLMESNPEEAIINNVIGTRNMAQAAEHWGAELFVNISTDKAVNPTSVMGASKFLAECCVQYVSMRVGSERSFVSVRFGNVLGSRGSVIPLFKRQIALGGPVTVTHPEMKRYFMTIPEAAQLVLQAGSLGGNGLVYVLDMGQPVKIVDLARNLITLSGLEPDIDISITYSGLRPGEKLFEELLTAEERQNATTHEKIFIAHPPLVDTQTFEKLLADLTLAAQEADRIQIRTLLNGFVRGAALEMEQLG